MYKRVFILIGYEMVDRAAPRKLRTCFYRTESEYEKVALPGVASRWLTKPIETVALIEPKKYLSWLNGDDLDPRDVFAQVS
jgi:hypothetical protein